MTFDVSNIPTITTLQCFDNVNTILINHIDIDSDNYGSITINYFDGTSMLMKFKGNGSLTFINNNEEIVLGKGFHNLQEILQLPRFLTAFCSNVYLKNTWEFCFIGLASIDFFTNTSWSGMNSIKILRSFAVPLHLRGTNVTSMQEHSEKIIISASDTIEGIYLKKRLEEFTENKFLDFEKINLDVLSFSDSDKIIFKCRKGDFKKLMNEICGSRHFFADDHGFLCCKSWYDVSLLNKFLGANLPLA